MTLLDASAVLGMLRGEPSMGEVKLLLDARRCSISTATLAEGVDSLMRGVSVPAELAKERISGVAQLCQVIPIDQAVSLRAGELRARHYSRLENPVSLADCFVVASTRPGDALATADSGQAAVARAEGIDVIALPNSRGELPA